MSSPPEKIRTSSGPIFKKIDEYSIKSYTYRSLGKNWLVFLQNLQHQIILEMYSRFLSDMNGTTQFFKLLENGNIHNIQWTVFTFIITTKYKNTQTQNIF